MHEAWESHKLRRFAVHKREILYVLGPLIHRFIFHNMAGSKFAYVRNFELPDPLLPETYIIFRLDGHSFHRSV